ncbi:MAG: hypothetical protein JOZ75_05200 [Candidatus Dormibacteraeota bacterium]|nr:hypothetical protein [Candidatus Dormibacteraeota bacterium]
MAIASEQSLSSASLRLRTNVRRLLTWRHVTAAIPLIVLGLAILADHQIYTVYRFDTAVHGDAEGYYAYLPSYLIYHDVSLSTVIQRHVIPAYSALGHQPPAYFGFFRQVNGNWLDRYGIGVAVLVLPFFVVGHVIALASHMKANGYSDPELYAAAAATIACLCAGLLALRAVLQRWCADWAVAVTLVAVTFGTSLFNFATWDPVNSHAYSFFAFALLLLATLRWYERPRSWPRALLVGALCGLIVDIRPTDALLLIALPLLQVGSMAAFRARLRLFAQHRLRLAAVAGAALLAFLPQSIVWHIATGHWVAQPYQGAVFDFTHPALLDSLFAFRPHGLLPYAPVLLFSFAGLIWAWFRRRDIALPVTAAFLPFWYLTSAWYDWSFSDGFGQRAFIDILPLLALPMAFFFTSLRGRVARLATVAVAGLFTAVTCALMLGYWQYRISGEGIDPPGYVAILAHPHRLLGPPEFPSWLLPTIPPDKR